MGGPIKVPAKAKEWQRRHDAACAVVARKYCDMFEFWRDCHYKPCRSARRCAGDQGYCLRTRWTNVPYDVGVAAQRRMVTEIPPKADPFARMAHYYAYHSCCLHDNGSDKPNGKKSVQSAANAETRPAAKTQS